MIRVLGNQTFRGELTQTTLYYGAGTQQHVIGNVGLDLSEFLRFTTIRNPFSRAVSLWQHYITSNNDIGFADFVDKLATYVTSDIPHFFFSPMHCWFVDFKPTMFLRLENLDEDFNKLPFVTQDTKLPRFNTTKHEAWPNYYTESLIEAVRFWATKDFELYSYSTIFERKAQESDL